MAPTKSARSNRPRRPAAVHGISWGTGAGGRVQTGAGRDREAPGNRGAAHAAHRPDPGGRAWAAEKAGRAPAPVPACAVGGDCGPAADWPWAELRRFPAREKKETRFLARAASGAGVTTPKKRSRPGQGAARASTPSRAPARWRSPLPRHESSVSRHERAVFPGLATAWAMHEEHWRGRETGIAAGRTCRTMTALCSRPSL